MVADGCFTWGDTNLVSVDKVQNHKGVVVGCSGDLGHSRTAHRWFADGQSQTDRPDIPRDSVDVMALDRDGTIWIGCGDLLLTPVTSGFMAIGSGKELALGAMAAGADAYEAVRIACRFDPFTREPVFGVTNQEAA